MLIDKKELMFFLGDLGPEVLPSLIDVYLSDSENTIQKITDAVASGDYVSLAREVHTLKGVGSTYGATRIRELAVELDGTHVAVFGTHVRGQDREGFAAFQRQGHGRQEGCAQHKLTAAGTYGIEAQGRENIPGAHLPAVVVAAQAFPLGPVHALHDLTQPALPAPGLRGPLEQIRNMVRRLVSMDIYADQAGLLDVLVVRIVTGLKWL